MSAIVDGPEGVADGPVSVVNVLFTMHPGFDTLDLCGPLEVLGHARHRKDDPTSKAFKCQFAAEKEHTVSAQGASFRAHMDFDDALEDIADFDILVVPGGSVDPVLKAAAESPVQKLIQKFVELQEGDPSKERTLMSVCTGSLFLAQAGHLQGMAATTHPDFYTKLEILCQEAARKGDYQQTDVMEVPYVVNNARYGLDEETENKFVFAKKPARERRRSIARKGSESMNVTRRRESIARRAKLPLGGMRLITSGGVTTGIDASLYLVSAMVSQEAAEEVARVMQYDWKKGVTVDGVDV